MSFYDSFSCRLPFIYYFPSSLIILKMTEQRHLEVTFKVDGAVEAAQKRK